MTLFWGQSEKLMAIDPNLQLTPGWAYAYRPV